MILTRELLSRGCYDSAMGVDPPDTADLFESLANETRVTILQALADAYGDSPADPWVEYSDLKERVGIRDNGNFDYHLRQLEGFVETRPAGYTLTPSGIELLSAARAGRFDADWTWGPVDAPGDCPFCDRAVELRYEEGVLWLTCGDDDHAMGLWASPALLVSRADDAVIDAVAFLGTQWAARTRRGICSECQGRVDGEIGLGGSGVDHYHYHAVCDHCGAPQGIPLSLYLLGHPVVWAAFRDDPVDVRTTPFWTLACNTPDEVSVRSEDPLRLRVDVELGGRRLPLAVSRDGSVSEADRS